MRRNSGDYSFSVKIRRYGDEIEYVAIFEDFPNLIGAGDTAEEAIKEGRENLDAYIDYCYDNSIPLPPPSDYEIKRCDYSGKVTLRMSKALHERAAISADIEGVSLNAFINDAISNYILVLEKRSFLEAVDAYKKHFPETAFSFIYVGDQKGISKEFKTKWEKYDSNQSYEHINNYMEGDKMVLLPLGR